MARCVRFRHESSTAEILPENAPALRLMRTMWHASRSRPDRVDTPA